MAVQDLEHAWHPWDADSRGLRLAHSLVIGQRELNALYPDRAQGAQEGTIGDATHRSEGTGSDHNPNSAGVVRAWDIDCSPGVPFDPQKLANTLAALMRTPGKYNFFGSTGYVIYNRRITAWSPWGAWVPYTGSDPHTRHIHVSVGANASQYDDTETWALATLLGAKPAPKPPAPKPPAPPAIAKDSPMYVRFPKFANPKMPNAHQAIYAWNGGTLTWMTAQDWAVIGHGQQVFDIPDHRHSNIFRCPAAAGTPDPRR